MYLPTCEIKLDQLKRSGMKRTGLKMFEVTHAYLCQRLIVAI